MCVSGSLVLPSLRRCAGSEGSRQEDLHSRPWGGVGLQRVLQELEVGMNVSQAGPFKWAQQDASVEMVPPNAGLRLAGPERLQRALFLLSLESLCTVFLGFCLFGGRFPPSCAYLAF